MFFKVETIQVTGASRYQAADIIAASGVEAGDNLVLLDRYRVSQRIYTALPYITDVQPRPKFPSTLEIEVTETRAAAAIQGAGGWWLLSAGGKILEAADGSMAAGYPQITGVYAKDPAVSDPLVLPEDGVITAQRLQKLLSLVAAGAGDLDGLHLEEHGERRHDGRRRQEEGQGTQHPAQSSPAASCRMGADIRVADRVAVVTGVPCLCGASVRCTDLRGGAALLVAGAAAQGETRIGDIFHIQRGYQDPVGDLRQLGARIETG